MSLQNDRKMLLNKVERKGDISPKDLYEDETVDDTFGSKRTVERALKSLCNEEGYLKREKDGKKWLYSVTNKGKNFLKKIRKRERQRKDEEDIFDYDNGFDQFVQYFESQQWAYRQIEKASIGRNFVYLDYQRLERFNHELADDLLNDPDSVLQAAREAVRSLPEVEDDIDVRVKNVSDVEQQTISDLSARDRNNLVSIDGVIQSVSQPGSKIVSASFECTACGDRYEKEQDTANVKSPYKCDCGNKKFNTIREKHKTVRYLNLKEKPDQRSRDKVVAIIQGDLAEDESKNLKAIGSGVKVIGYVDTYQKKKSDEFQSFRLVANNIEIEETKWEVEELTPEREKEIQQLSRKDDVATDLAESLGYEVVKGNKLLKESFVVFLLGKSNNFGNVHFLCIGDPGTGKSHLAKYVSENSNRVIKSVATGATEVGLTAAVVKDEMTGQYTAEAGALAMADGGFHITDEVDELDDDHYSAYNEALSDETISLAKANIQAELSADVSEFALGNPSPHYSFDDTMPLVEQIPIKKDDLISRFGIMLAVRDNDETEDKLAKAEHMLQRGRPGAFNEDEDYINEDLLFDYIHYAQRINPRMSDAALDKIMSALENLFDESDEDRIKLRHANALAGISVAYARMNLSEEVEPVHVGRAFEFFRECYDSIGFDIGKDDFNDFDALNNRKQRDVRQKVKKLQGDEGADVEDIIDNLDYNDDTVEEVIDHLKSEGELFEPDTGLVKVI